MFSHWRDYLHGVALLFDWRGTLTQHKHYEILHRTDAEALAADQAALRGDWQRAVARFEAMYPDVARKVRERRNARQGK